LEEAAAGSQAATQRLAGLLPGDDFLPYLAGALAARVAVAAFVCLVPGQPPGAGPAVGDGAQVDAAGGGDRGGRGQGSSGEGGGRGGGGVGFRGGGGAPRPRDRGRGAPGRFKSIRGGRQAGSGRSRQSRPGGRPGPLPRHGGPVTGPDVEPPPAGVEEGLLAE